MYLPSFLRIVVSGKREYVQTNDTTKAERIIYDFVDTQQSDYMAKAIGLPYKLLLPVDGEYGRLLPGTNNWTGMIGMIQRGEADLAISIVTMTEERIKAVPFSYPLGVSGLTFATRKPEYSPDLTVFLWPFSKEVWSSIILCLVVMPTIFYLLSERANPALELFMSTLRILFRQNLQQQPEAMTDCFLLAGWILGCTFLSCFYSAVLLSVFSFPPLSGIRTIRELSSGVKKGEYQCTTYPGGFAADTLLNSNDPLVRVIGHSLKENEGSNDIDSVLENKRGKKPVFIGGMPHFIPLKDKYFVSDDTFFNALLAVVIRKDFCCKAKMNRAIHYFWASGLNDKFWADRGFLERLRKNHNSSSTDGSNERKLTLKDFAGLFVFLLSSYIAAFLLLIAEILAGKRSSQTSEK